MVVLWITRSAGRHAASDDGDAEGVADTEAEESVAGVEGSLHAVASSVNAKAQTILLPFIFIIKVLWIG
jgi:hypothetical protein